MKSKNFLGLLGLLVVGLVATAGIVSAFGLGFGANAENREKAREAIEAGDFAAWKEAISSELTEENFNQLAEMRKDNSEMRQARESLRLALEAGDYEDWKQAWEEASESLPSQSGAAEALSEEDFNTLYQIHQAKMQGDFETAKELAQELEDFSGLGPALWMGEGFGMGKGFDAGKGNGMHKERGMMRGEMANPGCQNPRVGVVN